MTAKKKNVAREETSQDDAQETRPEQSDTPTGETAEQELEQAEAEAATAENGAAEEAAGEDETAEPDPIAELQREKAELKDSLLRTLAEMENLRRRTQKEREEAQRYAPAALAKALLPVADNLRRALESVDNEAAKDDEQLKGLIAGVEMTEKELQSAFEKNNITVIDPKGEKLDPNLHEAMFEVPDETAEPGTVVQVLEVGYRLHDRLLRPARVGVAKKP